MLYMLYCKETEIVKLLLPVCRQGVREEILKDAYLFTAEHMRRYQGEWHLETVNLFPDCIFLESRFLEPICSG